MKEHAEVQKDIREGENDDLGGAVEGGSGVHSGVIEPWMSIMAALWPERRWQT